MQLPIALRLQSHMPTADNLLQNLQFKACVGVLFSSFIMWGQDYLIFKRNVIYGMKNIHRWTFLDKTLDCIQVFKKLERGKEKDREWPVFYHACICYMLINWTTAIQEFILILHRFILKQTWATLSPSHIEHPSKAPQISKFQVPEFPIPA